MTANFTQTASAGTVSTSDRNAAFSPSQDPKIGGVRIPTSLRLVFVGRRSATEWAELRDIVHRTFGGAIEVTAAARIADLGGRDVKHADIVFVQGAMPRCSHKIRLKIAEVCPLASTIYLTTARRSGDQSRIDIEAVHLTISRPILFEQVVLAIFAAMRRRICCLKLALSTSEPEPRNAPNLLERLFLLTPQETRVLSVMLTGLPNKLVARHLSVTVRTVKAHLTEIYRKTGTSQRAELIAKGSQLAAMYAPLPRDSVADLEMHTGRSPILGFGRFFAPRLATGAKSSAKALRLPRFACEPKRMSASLSR